VVSASNLQKQGSTELAAQLAVSVPSIDFPRPSNTDGTDAVRRPRCAARAPTRRWC